MSKNTNFRSLTRVQLGKAFFQNPIFLEFKTICDIIVKKCDFSEEEVTTVASVLHTGNKLLSNF